MTDIRCVHQKSKSKIDGTMEDHRLAPKRHNANDTRRIYWNHFSRSNYSLAKHLTWCQLTWCHRNDNFSSLNIDSSVLFKNHEVITKRVNASSNTKITKSSVPTKQQFERIHFDSPRRLSQVICVINYHSFHPWWNKLLQREGYGCLVW